MIKHNVEQGSPEWLQLRIGIPTASEFKKIVTPTGKLSTQARAYAFYLIAEKLLNTSLDSIGNLEWVARGKEMEPYAVKAYEFEYETTTETIGFATTDDGKIGASPDRLVGDVGIMEIKCPAPQTQIAYLYDGLDKDYIPQIQGQLYVTGREWCDFYSWHPNLPAYRCRVERDEKYIALLADSIAMFNKMKDEAMEKISALGYFAERSAILTPHEMAYSDEEIREAHEKTKVFMAG